MSLYSEFGVEAYGFDCQASSCKSFLEYCSDFVVIEELFEGFLSSSGYPLYVVVKCGVDTGKAIIDFERASGARVVGYGGLKDAHSISIQYFNANKLVTKTIFFEWGWVKPVGFSKKRLSRGLIQYNTFKVTLKESLDKALDCFYKIARSKTIPNYYGHQRFGVEKPYSHELGVVLAREGLPGLKNLLRDYGKRGWWEDRVLRGEEVPGGVRDLLLSAMQAYVFNKCLSKIMMNCNREWIEKLRGKAGVLPGDGFEKIINKPWVCREHAECSLSLYKELVGEPRVRVKARVRPLTAPIVDSKAYLDSENNVLKLVFKLGSGSYASIVLRELFRENEEWVYKRCRKPPEYSRACLGVNKLY